MIAYISIGNSDDKLTQQEWARYVTEIRVGVIILGQVHGAWFSVPDSVYQNACWCVEFPSDELASTARTAAAEIRAAYRQDSVAWATAVTEFI